MKSLNDYLPEKHEIRTTSRGLVYRDGRLLVMRRTRKLTTGEFHTYLSIPGGTIESGEDPLQTAKREVYEETSIEVEPKRLVAVVRRKDGCVHNFVWCDYISGEPRLHPDGPEAAKQSAENHFEPLWLPVGEVTDEALHPEYEGLEGALRKIMIADGRTEQPIEI
jgi:8-oxo-dGTP pyrophosphatase MutT (NUDIX family)